MSRLQLKFLAFGLFLFYLLSSIAYYKKSFFSFDEPHYILAAYSIYHDGDLDLRNNYTERHYAKFYAGELDPHISVNSQDHRWYSIHGYGLSVLLIPAIWLAEQTSSYASGDEAYLWGLRIGVAIEWGLIFAISFYLIASAAVEYYSNAYLGKEVIVRSQSLHLQLVILALFLINPILIYTKFIAVEVIAFLYTAFLLRILMRNEWGGFEKYIFAFLSAILPCMHVKFLIITLGGFLVCKLWFRNGFRRSDFFIILGPILLSLIFLVVLNKELYGTYALDAAYQKGALSLSYAAEGLIGQFVDAHTGLFFVAPIYGVLLPLAVALVITTRDRLQLLPLILIVLPLLGLGVLHVIRVDNFTVAPELPMPEFIRVLFSKTDVVPMWFQTPSARFLLPAVPIFVGLMGLPLLKSREKKAATVLVVVALLGSMLLSWIQVFVWPHTLFRPNADFESHAPIWAYLLRGFVWVLPNMLSLEQGYSKLVLGVAWIVVFFLFSYWIWGNLRSAKSVYFYLMLGMGFIMVSASIIKSTAADSKMLVMPNQMRSRLSFVDEEGVRVYQTQRQTTDDVLYGPYLYLLSGSYCITPVLRLEGRFQYLKWYVADAFSGRAYTIKEITSPSDFEKLADPLCFDNTRPQFPKEFKLFAMGFVGRLHFSHIMVRKIESQ